MTPVPQADSAGAFEHSRTSRARLLGRFPGSDPQLLVSIRSVDEAQRAIAGGADILDVKEPSRGSLGMAAISDISQIATIASIASGAIPLSVALGEVADWLQASTIPKLPEGISFAKLGLSRCATAASWRADWRNVRTRFEHLSPSRLRWVAVAYADAEDARSPCIAEVLDEAIESKCEGLLIDTWSKGSLTLLDTIDTTTLTRLAKDCHAAGMFLALAGKLRCGSLPGLADVPMDIIAIRSAACVQSERTADVEPMLVANFKQELKRRFNRP